MEIVSWVWGTDLHIPGKATEVTPALAAARSAAPSVGRPRVCSACSAACTLASSTALHSLEGVNGWLGDPEQTERETYVNKEINCVIVHVYCAEYYN